MLWENTRLDLCYPLPLCFKNQLWSELHPPGFAGHLEEKVSVLTAFKFYFLFFLGNPFIEPNQESLKKSLGSDSGKESYLDTVFFSIIFCGQVKFLGKFSVCRSLSLVLKLFLQG